MIDVSQVSFGILAGGRGSRLGGADKASLEYQGQSLLARTLRAFPEAFAERLLSYNCGPADSGAMRGLRIVPDLRPGQQGPLAALEALFLACRTRWLLTTPVDVRDWPTGLATELLDAVGKNRRSCVLADVDGLQPLVGLWDVTVMSGSASSALDSGERAVHRWLAANPLPVHDISPRRLGNLNSPADFASR